jgi:hypothetical protein
MAKRSDAPLFWAASAPLDAEQELINKLNRITRERYVIGVG